MPAQNNTNHAHRDIDCGENIPDGWYRVTGQGNQSNYRMRRGVSWSCLMETVQTISGKIRESDTLECWGDGSEEDHGWQRSSDRHRLDIDPTLKCRHSSVRSMSNRCRSDYFCYLGGTLLSSYRSVWVSFRLKRILYQTKLFTLAMHIWPTS